MRTTIILKARIARQISKLAGRENRKLSNMIHVLVGEALEGRERAARRAKHLRSVLHRLRGFAAHEEHRRSATRLREDLDA